MQKRFLDPLFFAFLFLVDVVVWLASTLFGSAPHAVMVMAPALASVALIALGRTLLNLEPKRFWSGLTAVTLVFTVFLGLTGLITSDFNFGDGIGFATAVWFMGVALICSIIALFLAAVGAIPGPVQSDVEEAELDADRIASEVDDIIGGTPAQDSLS